MNARTFADSCSLPGRVLRVAVLMVLGGVVACQVTPPVVPATTNALEDRVDQLESVLQATQKELAATQASLAQVEDDLIEATGRLDSAEGRLTTAEVDGAAASDRLDAVETDLIDLLDAVDALPPTTELVDTALVLAVPGNFADIPSALASLDDVWFIGDGSATIQVASGSYTLPAAIRPTHPQGQRISILGNPADPATVVLQCDGESCLSLDGTSFGTFNGFTMRGSTPVDGQSGVSVVGHGSVTVGPNVVIGGFPGYGILATDGGARVIARGVEIVGCGNGILADDGSYVDAEGARVTDNDSLGIEANWTSMVRAVGSTVENNGATGILAQYGSSISAGSATSRNNSYGVYAHYGSTIRAREAVLTGNATYDARASNTSSVDVDANTVMSTSTPPTGTDGGANSWIQ